WLDDALDFITGLVEDSANWAGDYLSDSVPDLDIPDSALGDYVEKYCDSLNFPDIGIDMAVALEGGRNPSKGIYAKACVTFTLEFLGAEIGIPKKCLEANFDEVCVPIPWPVNKTKCFSL
ncbi:MAG: hypothetical protein ACI9OJ_000645, partial [Myxococcota bacterium]